MKPTFAVTIINSSSGARELILAFAVGVAAGANDHTLSFTETTEQITLMSQKLDVIQVIAERYGAIVAKAVTQSTNRQHSQGRQ